MSLRFLAQITSSCTEGMSLMSSLNECQIHVRMIGWQGVGEDVKM